MSPLIIVVLFYLVLVFVCISFFNVSEICLKLESGFRMIRNFPTIQALVSVTLYLATQNFHKWKEIFLVTLGKYLLQAHVLSDVVHRNSAEWCRMNCAMVT